MYKTSADVLKEEGAKLGEVRAQRRSLLRLLQHKFGKLPASIVKRIEARPQFSLLDAWFDKALTAATLAEVGIATERAGNLDGDILNRG